MKIWKQAVLVNGGVESVAAEPQKVPNSEHRWEIPFAAAEADKKKKGRGPLEVANG